MKSEELLRPVAKVLSFILKYGSALEITEVASIFSEDMLIISIRVHSQ